MRLHNDLAYLQHILDAISQISEQMENIDEESFKLTNIVQDAVIRQVLIIGEATVKTSISRSSME